MIAGLAMVGRGEKLTDRGGLGARGGLGWPACNFWIGLATFTLTVTGDSLPFVNLLWPWRDEIPGGKVQGEGAETGAIVRPVPGNCFGAEWVSEPVP